MVDEPNHRVERGAGVDFPYRTALASTVDPIVNDPWAQRALLRLLRHPDRWIRRRVETIRLESWEESTTWVSLDIWLDTELQEHLRIGDGRLLIPVGFGVKGQPISRFELSADGDSASLVSSAENTAVSAAVLGTALDDLGFVVPSAWLRALCGGGDGSSRARVELTRRLHSEAGAAHDGGPARGAVRLVEQFAHRFVLYASVRAGEVLTAQRSIKFSQAWRRIRQLESGASEFPAARAGDSSVGARVMLPLWDFGFGGRYHVDIEIPEHLRARTAVLAKYQLPGLADPTVVPIGSPVHDVDRVTLETPAGAGGHVGVWDEGFAYLELSVERRAIHAEALWLARALGLVALFGFALLLLGDRAPGGALAVLLAPVVPASALLFRPSPDRLTPELTKIPRRGLLAQVAFGLFWTLLVAVGVSLDAAHELGVLGMAVVGVTLFLFSAFFVRVQKEESGRAALDR